MKRIIFLGAVLAVALSGAGAATNDVALPPTSEIIDALKSHYVDREKLDQKLLNDATVTGILQALGAGARLLTAEEAASNAVPVVQPVNSVQEPLARVEIIDPDIGYIRVSDVMGDTALALDAELKKFAVKKATAYVLDLRYADGTNFAAAATVASRFLPADEVLFTLKQAGTEPKVFRSTDAPHSLASELAESPLMLLVNAETRGCAEVLAGALRAHNRGIVVGGATAGSAVAWEDVKLADGLVLRLATAKISLPDGGEIFPGGIVPDILVKIDPKIEHQVVFNVQSNMTLTASLQPLLKKHGFSEAELVKAFRGEALPAPTLTLQHPDAKTNTLGLGLSSGVGTNATPAVEEEPVETQGRDVVLQRAVDILKGIRVLLSWQ